MLPPLPCAAPPPLAFSGHAPPPPPSHPRRIPSRHACHAPARTGAMPSWPLAMSACSGPLHPLSPTPCAQPPCLATQCSCINSCGRAGCSTAPHSGAAPPLVAVVLPGRACRAGLACSLPFPASTTLGGCRPPPPQAAAQRARARRAEHLSMRRLLARPHQPLPARPVAPRAAHLYSLIAVSTIYPSSNYCVVAFHATTVVGQSVGRTVPSLAPGVGVLRCHCRHLGGVPRGPLGVEKTRRARMASILWWSEQGDSGPAV